MTGMVERGLRVMPPVLVVMLLLGFAVGRATKPISDPDDWWHLRLGNDLIDQRSLSAPDDWSAFATVPWVPTEPVPEIVAARVERWWGLPGLAMLFAVAGIVVILVVYLVSRRFAAALPAALATSATLLAISGSLTSRPQLVSFALFPIVVAAWLRTEQDHRARWWLVPLTWVWSLCHGFWFLGAGYGVLFVAGFAMSRTMPLRDLGRQAAVAVVSFVVVLLSPVGLGVFEAPFRVNDSAKYIQEWDRVALTSPPALAVLVMVVVTAVVCVAARRDLTWPRMLVLLSAVFWTWYAGRTVAVAGLVVAPLFAQALGRLVQWADHAKAVDRSEPARRTEAALLASGAVLAAVVVGLVAPTTADRPGDVPTALDPALDGLPAGARIFNAYELGGWIVWRHPDLEQYIDGLVTPYSTAHVERFAVAVRGAAGWDDVVDSSGAAVALLQEDSRLAVNLADAGWVEEGTDAGYVLLTRPGS
jgi:hypothetical protein